MQIILFCSVHLRPKHLLPAKYLHVYASEDCIRTNVVRITICRSMWIKSCCKNRFCGELHRRALTEEMNTKKKRSNEIRNDRSGKRVTWLRAVCLSSLSKSNLFTLCFDYSMPSANYYYSYFKFLLLTCIMPLSLGLVRAWTCAHSAAQHGFCTFAPLAPRLFTL